MKHTLLLLATALLGLGSCARESGLTNQPNSETKTDHLIIKEVFYAGHATTRDLSAYNMPSQTTRNYDDQYITIYNPSDRTLYLDSLALVTNQIDPKTIFEFAPGDNFVGTYYGASAVMYFAGNGTEHPVKPGQTVVIAKYAIDHAAAYVKGLQEQAEEDGEEVNLKEYSGYEAMLDLSKADYEWSSPKKGLNNPQVPDLTPISPDRGFSTISEAVGIALVRLPWSPKTFAEAAARASKAGKDSKGKDVVLHYINVTNTDFADFWAIEIPLNKVIDCMTICPRKRFQMRPSILDKGFLGVTEDDFSTYKSKELVKYMGLSLQRKWDGKGFVDTDNTTQDFEVKPATLSRTKAAEKPAEKPAK